MSVSANNIYLQAGALNVEIRWRGMAWIDPGTHESLFELAQFVEIIERRQSLKIACPEENAFRNGFIDAAQLERLAAPLLKNAYGRYLMKLIREKDRFL
jgi:glucose-1-phosphate thymidylyltransferase